MDLDLELLARWQQGDRKAGNTLFARYYDRVTLFFNNAVGECDRMDLTQETFARLAAAAPKFEGRSSLKTYLYSIARNVLNDHLRRRYRGPGEFDPLTHTLQDASSMTPSRAVSELGRYRALLDCLYLLPVETKVLLELYYWHDMTGPQLAELYKSKAATIRVRVHDAKGVLKTCVAAHQPGVSSDDIDAALDDDLRRIGELLSSGPTAPTKKSNLKIKSNDPPLSSTGALTHQEDTMALVISDESPIHLDGGLDGTGNLQIYYGTSSLASYGDALHAYHEDEPVRIEIHDFTESSTTWTMNATGTSNWSRSSTYCYFDFDYTDGEVSIDVEATAGAQTKTKTVTIKVRPIVELK